MLVRYDVPAPDAVASVVVDTTTQSLSLAAWSLIGVVGLAREVTASRAWACLAGALYVATAGSYRTVAFCKVPVILDLLRQELGDEAFFRAWRKASTTWRLITKPWLVTVKLKPSIARR